MQRLEVSGAVHDIYIYDFSRLRVKDKCWGILYQETALVGDKIY
jgi:hypothetical protein